MSQVWHRRKSPGPDSDVRSSRSQSLRAERSSVFTEPCPMWPRPWERLENLLGGGGGCVSSWLPQRSPWRASSARAPGPEHFLGGGRNCRSL